ncbi:MAG: hypothetical protein COY19_07630 [Candidatus Marinimicrobia bacterium CG_4_10_14_0_2_um_filter_48_9]|nr:MAG: hypothetical protein COY19_07630 [Candidatus Marinimicrobia bacterium CG_4_10_14_0_2_um_filter_48_9]
MEQMYSLKTVAKLLAISVETLRRLIRKYGIQTYTVGSRIRLKQSGVEELVDTVHSLEDYGINI